MERHSKDKHGKRKVTLVGRISQKWYHGVERTVEDIKIPTYEQFNLGSKKQQKAFLKGNKRCFRKVFPIEWVGVKG